MSLHRIAAEPLAARVGHLEVRRLREGDRRRQQVIVERVEQVVELRPEVVPVGFPAERGDPVPRARVVGEQCCAECPCRGSPGSSSPGRRRPDLLGGTDEAVVVDVRADVRVVPRQGRAVDDRERHLVLDPAAVRDAGAGEEVDGLPRPRHVGAREVRAPEDVAVLGVDHRDEQVVPHPGRRLPGEPRPRPVANRTRSARSPLARTAAPPPATRAAATAAPAPSRAVADGARSPAAGEPETLMSRPSTVTLASNPFGKTSTPPTRWAHARWWVPPTST